jgi:hypothetical protein
VELETSASARIKEMTMKSLMSYALGTILAGATAGVLPSAAQAAGHDVIDINVRPPLVERRVYEDRAVQVWVEPVYQTVVDRHWVEPVYRTVTDRVWVPAATQTVSERVWVPDRYEDRRVVHDRGFYGPRVTYDRVLVPGHFEDRTHDVVTPGHYDDVQRQELVTDGHWETGPRQVVVTPGHYETHIEHVLVDRPVGRIGVRIPMP